MMADDGSERPPFVVVEGLDGVGTTTQCRLLVERLRDEGIPAGRTREPSDGPVGTMVRQMLSGRIVVADDGESRPVDSDVLALLFAADRLDHLDAEIEPALAAGRTVVSDRYYHSSFAYQADRTEDGIETDWVRTLNERARPPDVTFYLEAPVDVCLERMDDREGRDRYETPEELAALETHYDHVVDELSSAGERIERIDATREVDAIHEALYERITDVVPGM